MPKEPEVDCGLSLPAPFAHFDPATSSWKTSQLSLDMDSTSCSVTCTSAGTMRSGKLYPLTPLVPLTKERGFSSWPTPRASMDDHGVCWTRAETGDHHSNLEDFIAWLWLREHNVRTRGLNANPDWLDWYMMFPVGYSAVAR